MFNKVQHRFIENSQEKIHAIIDACKTAPYTITVQETILGNALTIKSKAQSVNLSLLATILNSLCDYSDKYMMHDKHADIILSKHAEIIELVLQHDIAEHGGVCGEKLAHLLPQLIAHFNPSAKSISA